MRVVFLGWSYLLKNFRPWAMQWTEAPRDTYTVFWWVFAIEFNGAWYVDPLIQK